MTVKLKGLSSVSIIQLCGLISLFVLFVKSSVQQGIHKPVIHTQGHHCLCPETHGLPSCCNFCILYHFSLHFNYTFYLYFRFFFYLHTQEHIFMRPKCYPLDEIQMFTIFHFFLYDRHAYNPTSTPVVP